ncbi:KGK domain-containing protein [Limnoraphis robusta]|uniref:KGK domain-containing protein n=1 Tax=Limnoraphis robusta CCNP1315 TaxID=3110306 RepID=A0ABU5TUP0_9CYAN|nr:KGK domain-containing protein [Limnoraphis robusta]MEA5518615.1 KGK domain-containing protein [Limnoraphis robusta CCNP1315]MEA5547990.1 KGK domain-containing protein [Limnoraphis robusta CCNP1324]
MNEENFRRLHCDDDIVIIEKDTFTVERLKELLSQNLKELVEKTSQHQTRSLNIKGLRLHHHQDIVASMAFLFYQYCWLSITDKSIKFDLSDIRFVIPPKGIECKLLSLENPKWIEGKVRFLADLKINEQYLADVTVEVEFSPQPTNLTEESTNEDRLDDLRAKLNQLNEA